ncbi:hypothetical protein [Lentzea waywayandensis]|uniref:hypothetical protein n=1 Tax=Lentzea waywayandensis TaxID=84724 RepID=UPI0015A59063|nr:hypothetical protein [Lentzea waywayandensis]
MLVQVERVVRSSDDVVLAYVRTSVGLVVARWCGELEATPGAHHVEWELDEEFRWGLNCSEVEVGEPLVRENERGIFVQGQLGLEAADQGSAFAHLEFADALILLGHINGLPEGMAGSWVELHLPHEKVKVYPYLA